MCFAPPYIPRQCDAGLSALRSNARVPWPSDPYFTRVSPLRPPALPFRESRTAHRLDWLGTSTGSPDLNGMPRFHFDLVDSKTVTDQGGQLLEDSSMAIQVANRLAEELSKTR